MPNRKGLRLAYNAPAVLTFALLCVAVRFIGMLTGGASDKLVFSVYGASLLDPLAWVRLFGHVMGHSGWEHLLNNMMYILILGPMIEEKYGTSNTVFVILATALVTGILSMIIQPNIMLLGASGVVFAFILLASITSVGERTIPLTFILVAVLYIGREVYTGLTASDSVSQLAHIIGGLVGAALGFVMNHMKMNRYGSAKA